MRGRRWLPGACAAVIVWLCPSTTRAQTQNPVDAILHAFQSHAIVALAEGDHGNEQGLAVRLALVRDPRFAAAVNDIVVESGNALYQDAIDRFIRGEPVPDQVLRQAWQNTTQPFTTFDNPIYEEFFRAVRAVNAGLPPDGRLRVLLGDPPIDWSAIQNRDQVQAWVGQRDSHAAAVIRREVLAKGRRALVVYGGMHLQRKNVSFNYGSYDDPRVQTVVQQLEGGAPPVKVFSIWANTTIDLRRLLPEASSWPTPSLALTRGSALGAADFTAFYTVDGDRLAITDGQRRPVPRADWRTLRMEDQFDAVLDLGTRATITIRPLSPSICAEPGYLEMRVTRFALVGLSASADQLKKFCAGALPK